MLVRVQAERAQTSNPEDRASIVQAVQATVGFQRLNAMVKAALREWCLQQALQGVTKLEAEGGTGGTFPGLCHQVATVFSEFGQHSKALEYYAKSLAITQATLGEQHPSTAATYNGMALVYDKQGEYSKALEYYAKGLAITQATLGEQHPSTATTYNNMASVYNNQGEYSKALEYYAKSLAICQATLGEQHPHTVAIRRHIAMCSSRSS
jgi:tetratricopeptide (TPR) repeat protein